MSDAPQGPGWWLASDGKYYPPQNTSPPPPPTPPPFSAPQPYTGHQQSNWGYQQPAPAPQKRSRLGRDTQVIKVKQRSGCFTKALAIVGALVIIGIVIAALGGSDDDGPSNDATESEGPAATRFPGRPDSQEKDQEREIGATARINDLEATVTSIEFVQSLNEFENAGYIVVTMTYTNRSDRAIPYNTFDWRFQTSNGQVLDPGFYNNTLGSGDLVPGGSVSGTVIFDAPARDGFILWKPFLDSDRGIWKVG